MISSAPRTPKPKFDTFSIATVEPIYDMKNGEPIYIPAGYIVKVIDSAANDMYRIAALTPTGFVKVLATKAQLGIGPLVDTDADSIDLVDDTPVVVPDSNEPLIPRIYQEYGITFLLWKGRAELADAPGVGKTIQALEAAWRAMQALKAGIDPLELCYQHDLSNLHDEKNTHPTERPFWAQPHERWYKIKAEYGINVYEKNKEYYWAKHLNPVTVIVAPNHLCSMWFKAIRRQYPDAHVALATGGGAKREERMAVLGPGRSFYIVNYEMMRPAPEPKEKDYVYESITTDFGLNIQNKKLRPDYVKQHTFSDALAELNPVCVIFDEAHNLKSTKSKQARECAEFAFRVPYRFMLTATPIKREADDLYMQLHIMDPYTFDGQHLSTFVEDHCFYKQTEYGRTNIQLRDGSKRLFWFNRIESLETAGYDSGLYTTKKSSKKYTNSFTDPNLKGYILGRSYRDVGLYLPPVIPANIPVEMDGNIREIYNKLKRTYKATFEELGESIEISSMIAMIHNLRILTACPNKYRAVKDLIEDNEGPFAIFCEYKASGEELATVLGTTFVSGEIPVEEREELCAKLIAEGKPVVGMGRVIGTGINSLNACNVIINWEADWTPGERTQRIGRVQRFSPNRPEGEPILLFDVFVTDSMDQHVYEVQKNRGISIRDIITVELGIK